MVYAEEHYLSSTQVILICACLLGAALGVGLLSADLTGTRVLGAGGKLGLLKAHRARVKSRTAGNFIWESVQDGEPLYRLESVQTGAGASAVIQLGESESIEMGEESLIIVDRTPELSLRYLEGTALWRTARGDRRIHRQPGGEASVDVLPLHALTPRPLDTFYVEEGHLRPISFSWHAADRTSRPLTLEVRTRNENGPERTQTAGLPPAAEAFEWRLPAGRYTWQIATQGKAVSVPGRFRIVAARALTPTAPGDGISLFHLGAREPVTFSWIAPPDLESVLGTRHTVEIATDSAFSQTVLTQEVVPGSGSARVAGLESGDFFWRLRSDYGGLTLTSGIRKFRLRPLARVRIQLDQPAEAQALERKDPIGFSWRADTETTDARTVWEVESPERTPIAHQVTSENAAHWTAPSPGVYRWRVRMLDGDRELGAAAWSAFSVYDGKPLALIEPRPGRRIDIGARLEPFGLAWEPVEPSPAGAVHYRVEAALDPQFQDHPLRIDTGETRVSSDRLGITPGSWFWKVTCLDAQDRVVRGSPVATFLFTAPPRLPAPAATASGKEPIFDPVSERRRPKVTWQPVPGAVAYEVTFYPPGTARDSRPERKRTREAGIEFETLSEGRYFWTVRAIDDRGREGEATPLQGFLVRYPKPLAWPKPVAPEVQ
jgi:hypothetical protein